MIDSFTCSNIQRALVGRLRKGPHTAESLSALLGIDLPLVRYALRGLEGLGRIEADGVLWRLVERGRAA